MLYSLLSIIPSIIFYKNLKTKIIYKIFLSILFWLFIVLSCVLLSNFIFNIYCTLTDKLGYNQIIKFIHYIFIISGYVFLTLITIFLYIAYKKQSRKLFNCLILFILVIIFYFILNFILNSIYYNLVEKFGYNNIYIYIYTILHRSLIALFFIGITYYEIKKVTQK